MGNSRSKRRLETLGDSSILNEAFSLQGSNGCAVLLIHGWSSIPFEMRALGEHLQGKGYSVQAPLLTGHGTKPEDLEGLVWQDWQRDAFDAYQKLCQTHERVYVGGMSTGGSLALHVAKRFPDVAGLVLLGTPYGMRYEKIGFYLTRVLKNFWPYKKKYYPKILGSERGVSELIAYDRYPYASAYEALYAIKSATTQLGCVQAPCMIVQSRHDHLITKGSMTRLKRELSGSQVTTRMIDKAYHNFIADRKHSYIFEEISAFLERCEGHLSEQTT